MWIHWGNKQMKFTYKGQRISLQGIVDDVTTCPAISAPKLRGLLKHGAVVYCLQLVPTSSDHPPTNDLSVCSIETNSEASCPTAIQNLIDEYSELFAEPSSLPPRRDADHQIPLLPGSQLVNVRPYRYSPAQKSEIEKQVNEMLQNGIIRTSSSPFASPVLLVLGDFVWTTGI